MVVAFDDPAEFERFSDFAANEMTRPRRTAMVNPRAGSQTALLQTVCRRWRIALPGTLFNLVLSAARGNLVGAIAMVRPISGGSWICLSWRRDRAPPVQSGGGDRRA